MEHKSNFGKYSLADKRAYYAKRVNDKRLSPGQRAYAASFLGNGGSGSTKPVDSGSGKVFSPSSAIGGKTTPVVTKLRPMTSAEKQHMYFLYDQADKVRMYGFEDNSDGNPISEYREELRTKGVDLTSY
jgi:hypothetical protein